MAVAHFYLRALACVVHHVARVIPEAYLATGAARVGVPGFLGHQGRVDLVDVPHLSGFPVNSRTDPLTFWGCPS